MLQMKQLMKQGITLIVLFARISCELVSWPHGHFMCKSAITSNNISSASRSNTHTKCHEMSYYKYAIKQLSNKSLPDYNRKLLSEIVNMYSELQVNLVHMNISISRSNITHKVFPYNFGMPRHLILATLPPKSQAIFPLIPGFRETYLKGSESDYYKQLESSLFALTYKKSNWDCFRHYEILSCGTLPLFLDIRNVPRDSLVFHPKKVYDLLLSFPGLTPQRPVRPKKPVLEIEYDWNKLDMDLYTYTVKALLHYMQGVMSNEQLAMYILHTVWRESNTFIGSKPPPYYSFDSPLTQLNHNLEFIPKKILFLTYRWSWGDVDTDFTPELLLIGLKNTLDEYSIIDYPKRNIYKDKSVFKTEDYYKKKETFYGQGYRYTLVIHDALEDTNERDKTIVESNIKNKVYDMIIIPNVHRCHSKGYVLDFKDLICTTYKPSQIVLVDGGDGLISKKAIHLFNYCAQHFFAREGVSKSPLYFK